MTSAPLAVSLGDPAGVGPELIVRAWQARETENLPPFFVTGGQAILDEITGDTARCIAIEHPGEATSVFAEGLPVLGEAGPGYRPSMPDETGAAFALYSLAEGTRHALTGAASAVVTAPVAKAQLLRVGFEFPGQTEFLAAACGLQEADAVMMLAGPQLRAVPVTVHCALAEVPARLTTELIVRKGIVTAQALRRDFGIEAPRLAVTGLNPHAGEGGKFGTEESEIIEPAIERLVAEGIDASGPHPADALFAAHKRDSFDAAICMYHDQALIPVKALDFDQGVNVTLGLPIIRTSPDHGTAFDIAGKDIADQGAMIAAIRMAGDMAKRRAGE